MTTTDILLRLTVATLAGCILGLDRELRDKPAGLRTHALVALGSALVTVTAFGLTNGANVDAVSRVIQGIIAGVGFLGAGAILKGASRDGVTGLTTAASIWLVASLGIACGSGHWLAVLITLVLALIVLIAGAPVEGFLRARFGARSAAPTTKLPGDDTR